MEEEKNMIVLESILYLKENISMTKWNGKINFISDKNNTYEIKNGKGFIKEYYSFSHENYEGEYISGERKGKRKESNIILIN